MAHAIVHSEIGSPDVLHLAEVADPVAEADQVVVKIAAAGVNPIDAKQRSGVRPLPPIDQPRRVGFDGAGVVTSVGDDVSGFTVGDRVAFGDTRGSYATALAVNAEHLALLPEGVTFAQGSALAIPAGTAYQALRSLRVAEGDVVLIHAGSGAVGQAAVQFARTWGATVIATGSPASHERLRELGALPVAYGPGLTDRVRALTTDDITVAFDAAGTDEAIETSLDLVADRTRIATIVRGADAAHFNIRAFSGGAPEPLSAQELEWRTEALPYTLDLIARGRFSIEFGPELPLAEAAEAHRLIEAHATRGKIVLVP